MTAAWPTNRVLIRALLLAAAVGCGVAWASFAIPKLSRLEGLDPELADFRSTPIYLSYFMMLPFAAVASVAIGFPIYTFVLRPYGVNWMTSIALGVICGGLLMALWPLSSLASRGDAILHGVAAGLAGGISFHFVVRASNNSLHRTREE